jgi:hypothetical protein
MPFKVGNKLSPGGKIGNKGGRPSKAKLAELEMLRRAVVRALDKNGARLAARYLEMAEADPPTMRHAIDRVLPPAKQAIEHSGLVVGIIRTNVASEDEEEERIRSARLVGPGES